MSVCKQAMARRRFAKIDPRYIKRSRKDANAQARKLAGEGSAGAAHLPGE